MKKEYLSINENPYVTCCLENLVAVIDGNHTIILDLDGRISSFEIDSCDQSQIRQAILMAFYRKMDGRK